MPTEISSSIQNPACSWRERTNNESRTRTGSPIGTSQREPTIASKRSLARRAIATTEELRSAFRPGVRLERDDPAAAAVGVDDVDLVVAPVGARDTQEERQPAPESELPLRGELAVENQRRPDLVEVGSAVLLDAVHEYVKRTGDAFRQLHLTR